MGAAVGAMSKARHSNSVQVNAEVESNSLKSNMGHLEACAAAAGLASLVLMPLLGTTVTANTHLHRWASSAYTCDQKITSEFLFPLVLG